MKLTIETTTKTEVEITFPHYRRNEQDSVYVAIFSENKAIKVGHWKFCKDIAIGEVSPATAIALTQTECTQHEFITFYENAVAKVNEDFDNLMSGFALEEDSKYDSLGALVDQYESNEEEGMSL